MPQMAPTNWILLMIYFIIIFFMFNTINYFILMPKMTHKKNNKFFQQMLNWKW